MTLTKYKDQFPFYSIREEMDKLFDTLLPRHPFTFGENRRGGFWRPRVDMIEEPKNYTIYSDLPGVDLKDIKISVNNNRIVIEGEKNITSNKENTNYNQQERHYGKFYCEVTPLANIEEEKISATIKNGVLKVEVPKKSGEETKYIEVKPI
jgi:HSP20 family protein